jgi:hypothetical protein
MMIIRRAGLQELCLYLRIPVRFQLCLELLPVHERFPLHRNKPTILRRRCSVKGLLGVDTLSARRLDIIRMMPSTAARHQLAT